MRITIAQLAVRAGVAHGAVERWIERGWIVVEEDGPSEVDAARARLIRDLLDDFGVNEEGVDIVLHLTDQLHGLRAAIARLQARDGG